MDPRIAWFPPEQLGKSHELWTRIWETQLMPMMDNVSLNNSNPNLEQKAQEFIPLDYTNNLDQKQGPSNRQRQISQDKERHKKENRASTYGLNHSSCVHLLTGENGGGLTPWRPPAKLYPLDPCIW
jgi:non-canonical poly(A) RNA polymerase PAPD5/7